MELSVQYVHAVSSWVTSTWVIQPFSFVKARILHLSFGWWRLRHSKSYVHLVSSLLFLVNKILIIKDCRDCFHRVTTLADDAGIIHSASLSRMNVLTLASNYCGCGGLSCQPTVFFLPWTATTALVHCFYMCINVARLIAMSMATFHLEQLRQR